MKRFVFLVMLITVALTQFTSIQALCSIDSYPTRDRKQAAYFCGYGMQVFTWLIVADPTAKDTLAKGLWKTANTLKISLDPNPLYVTQKRALSAAAQYVIAGDEAVKKTYSTLAKDAYLIGTQCGAALLALKRSQDINLEYSERANLEKSYADFISKAKQHCNIIGLPNKVIYDAPSGFVTSASLSQLLSWHTNIVAAIAGIDPTPKIATGKSRKQLSSKRGITVETKLYRGVHVNPTGTGPGTMPTYAGNILVTSNDQQNLTFARVEIVFQLTDGNNKVVDSLRLVSTKTDKADKPIGFTLTAGGTIDCPFDSDGYTYKIMPKEKKGQLTLIVYLKKGDKITVASFKKNLPPLNNLPSIGSQKSISLKMSPF